jgi:hypothetical protein
MFAKPLQLSLTQNYDLCVPKTSSGGFLQMKFPVTG